MGREFFSASWSQYEGVEAMDKTLSVIKQGPGTVWVEVTWFYADRGEHFCYQLVETPTGLRIAVLTLLDWPMTSSSPAPPTLMLTAGWHRG